MKNNINKIIAAELSGQLSESDKKELEEWLKDSTNQLVYQRIRKFWEKRIPEKEYIKSAEMLESLWNKVEKPKPRVNNYAYLWKVAAVLVLVFSSILFLIRETRLNDNNNIVTETRIIEKFNPVGIKSYVTLPDGSKVNLNSESRLKFPELFSDSLRIVELAGEAYFEVVEEKGRPFIVKTKNINTWVLGTTFNVQAFPEEDDVQITLRTGKVKVLSENNASSKEYILHPGQFIKFGKDENIETGRYNEEKVFGWKHGIILFEKASLETIISKLERWYGVEFYYSGTTPEWSFNGRFVNENLENVLEILSHSEKFNYVIDGKKVKLKF